MEHEAWNDSSSIRGNRMVDFLRPGMAEFSMRVPDEVREYAGRLFDGHDSDAGWKADSRNCTNSLPALPPAEPLVSQVPRCVFPA